MDRKFMPLGVVVDLRGELKKPGVAVNTLCWISSVCDPLLSEVAPSPAGCLGTGRRLLVFRFAVGDVLSSRFAGFLRSVTEVAGRLGLSVQIMLSDAHQAFEQDLASLRSIFFECDDAGVDCILDLQDAWAGRAAIPLLKASAAVCINPLDCGLGESGEVVDLPVYRQCMSDLARLVHEMGLTVMLWGPGPCGGYENFSSFPYTSLVPVFGGFGSSDVSNS